MIKIGVDILGGDYAPEATVMGGYSCSTRTAF